MRAWTVARRAFSVKEKGEGNEIVSLSLCCKRKTTGYIRETQKAMTMSGNDKSPTI